MQPRDAPGLHRKLVWLTFFRVVMVAVLLAGTAAVGWGEAAPVVSGLVPLFVLAGVVFAATVAFAIALRAGRWDVPVAYAHVVLDVGLATAVVSMTGRSESVFLFLYSLAVVNGSILLFRKGATTSGVLSVAGYLALNARLLGAPPVAPVTLFTHGAAFAATAVLASYLAEQLRSTGERLAARESDLSELEAEVRRSQRLADLGSLAAGLAHEIRNPLASMTGSIELLSGSASAGEDERRLMGIVLREAGRLNELVTQFLAFARPAAPRPVPTDLSALLDDTLRVFRNDPQAAGVRIEERLEPAAAQVDPDQLRQVIWNLLSNAAQALAALPRPGDGGIRVRCAAAPEGVILEVEDDGVGMSQEELGQIFIPFFTTRARGTGLGLATVHRIVEAHGGTIRVASERGAGSRFTVVLPAAPSKG
ncbi:MAG: ATP-binding protein [Anaeromyxobacteraceae bacterium]